MAQSDDVRDFDLERRRAFMGLDAEALGVMQGLRPFLAEALDEAMDAFYGRLASEPRLKELFAGESGLKRARDRQMQHWATIGEGSLDERFAAAVTRIGAVHARIGLEPRWYIGGYAVILGALVERLLAVRLGGGARGWLPGRAPSAAPGQVAAEVSVLVRAALLDMDLAISVYLDALEAERSELAAERAKREEAQDRVIAELSRVLSAVQNGDLTVRLGRDVPYGFRPMAETFDSAVAALAEALGRVRSTSGGLIQSAERIAGDTEMLAERTESQASSLEQSAAALHELTTSVASAADGATQAAEAIRQLAERSRSSAEAADRATGAVQAIENSSSQISQITQVIDSLAFQTNLLSLNASIEAARAGEAGRGFAVVALEVRNLAQRCADAARDINALLSESGGHVSAGVQLIGEMGGALREIAERVGEANQTVSDIALSAREQAQGLKEINEAVSQLETITQQNTAMVDQNRTRSAELRRSAQSLAQDVGSFRTRSGESDSPAPGVASAA